MFTTDRQRDRQTVRQTGQPCTTPHRLPSPSPFLSSSTSASIAIPLVSLWGDTSGSRPVSKHGVSYKVVLFFLPLLEALGLVFNYVKTGMRFRGRDQDDPFERKNVTGIMIHRDSSVGK